MFYIFITFIPKYPFRNREHQRAAAGAVEHTVPRRKGRKATDPGGSESSEGHNRSGGVLEGD